MADETTAAAASPDPATDAAPGGPQLSQVRVPLDEAAVALSTPDSTGRPPIVILPENALRIRMSLVAAGVVAIAAAALLDLSVGLRAALLPLGGGLIVLGVFRAFLVSVPEGSQAVLLRRGRFHRTLGAGNHRVPLWIIVSHIVTTRETPFDATALEIPTRDDVRMNLRLLLTFRIVAPEKFVFTLTVPDFDHVCQASAQDAVRRLLRTKSSDEMLDLSLADQDALRQDIAAALQPYGADVVRVVVTDVRPPAEFVQTRESRRLAAVQRAEEQELHALELLRLADKDEQDRERIRLHRAAIELEAENEVVRLGRLNERIREYPEAIQWDTESRRLDVAEALATNTRAMVQVGPGLDIAQSLLLQDGQAADGGPGDPQPGAQPAQPGAQPAQPGARKTQPGAPSRATARA